MLLGNIYFFFNLKLEIQAPIFEKEISQLTNFFILH